ncbi:17021_t:CDS:10, partial [Gigaspora margarita]
IQFVLAENEVQFEEKLKNFLSHVLKELASPHEIVRKKAIEILNHIKKRMTKTVKLPWNLLAELVCSENFMQFTLLKNFTIVFLKTAYDRLTEKDKITQLLPLIKNIELKSHNMKKILFQIIFELKFADLETKEVVDSLYSLYECSRLLSSEKELLCQSQSIKFEIMCYLCKSKLATNIFHSCPKTDANLQKKGVDFIQWITRTADTSIVELIGKSLLFGLLKIIKETRIENFKNLSGEQEINQTLLFKPFYGSPDLSIHNSEKDSENLKIIIFKFQELDQLDQFDQWTNEEIIQEIINILEENIDEQLMKGQMNIVINDNSKLSIVIIDKVNYSKEIYTNEFVSFTTSKSTINHLESNEDLLIINSKELISENSDKSTRVTVHEIELRDNSN